MTERARSELVEAREITGWDDGDKFRHQDVAEQLADLAVTAPTPANIALYGPWGSGKTGVGNLIERRLNQQTFRDAHPGCDKVRFVRFDAFKYAETPLRRHFLSQLAKQLLDGKSADGFRDRLYHSEVTSRLSFEHLKNGRVVLAFVLILGVGMLLAGLAAAIAAAVAVWASGDGDPGFVDRALSYFSGAVAFSFAPAAVLGGLFALAGHTLPVTRTKDSPSSDEQFEEQFNELLDAAQTERLVVFVDELDRCSPHQVVDILDTIRTFLDVKGTVFIVAADQNVLERALTERVRQTTPSDSSNPYYSTGSAYLDKVFHYQNSLPPLLPGRITRYAVELVKGRDGLWSDPDLNVEWLISVLIPTHVRSPRRVKTLVNNYVLSYRLARRRHEAGHLTTPPVKRAPELAKLVTLRTEFPRFANDLPVSSRLPDLLLALTDDPDAVKPSDVSDEIWARAKVFAFGQEDVTVMLVSGQREDAGHAELEEDSEDVADLGDQTVSEAKPARRSRDAAGSASAAMLQQLIHYLKKTQHIPNPHRDLIFLEAQGNLFNLDESIAEQVEDAAVGARTSELMRLVDDLEPETQTDAVRFLAQKTREAEPGVEGQNLVEGLLAVAGSRSPELIGPCADEAVEAVNAHGHYGSLSERSLPGALSLALGTNRDSTELVQYVLAHDATLTNQALGDQVLGFADQLKGHYDVIGEIAARRLLLPETSSATVKKIESLRRRTEVLVAAAGPFTNHLVQFSEVDPEQLSEDVEPDQAAIARALDVSFDVASTLESREILSFLVRTVLDTDDIPWWETVSAYVDDLDDSPASNSAREAILHRASHMTAPVILSWLHALPSDFADDDGDRAEMADQVARHLWDQRESLGSAEDGHDEGFVHVLRELVRISGSDAAQRRTDFVEDIDSVLTSGPSIALVADGDDVATAWAHLRRFTDEGVIAPPLAGALVARRLIEAFSYSPAPPQRTPPSAGSKAVLRRFALWVADIGAPDEVRSIANAIADCDWMSSPADRQLVLLIVANNHRHNPGTATSPYESPAVAEMAAEDPSGAAEAVSGWLSEFAGSAEEVNSVLLHYHEHYSDVREGLVALVDRSTPEMRISLAGYEIEDSGIENRNMRVQLLEDLRFADLDERAAADLLVGEYERSGTNNERRRELIEAWKALAPQGSQVRRSLIEGITLPTLASGGQEGFRVIFREIGLLADPVGVKTRLKRALRESAPKNERRRLESEMARLRITRKEKSGFLGFSEREVDED